MTNILGKFQAVYSADRKAQEELGDLMAQDACIEILSSYGGCDLESYLTVWIASNLHNILFLFQTQEAAIVRVVGTLFGQSEQTRLLYKGVDGYWTAPIIPNIFNEADPRPAEVVILEAQMWLSRNSLLEAAGLDRTGAHHDFRH